MSMMVYSVLKEVLKYDECGWSNARSRARGFLYEEKIAIIGLLTLCLRSFAISNIAHVILGLQTGDNRFSYHFVYFSLF
jgi:hypothetical protein